MQSLFAALVYSVWQHRNDVIWNAKLQRSECVVNRICKDVYYSISNIVSCKMRASDIAWMKCRLVRGLDASG